MQKRGVFVYFKFLPLAVLLAFAVPGFAGALTSNSDSYQLSEVQLGGTINQSSCSDGYCAEVSIGDMTAGESSSESYSIEFGEIVDADEPMLEVIVEDGQSNLGVLSTESTATKTALVKVRSYLAGGYILQIVGDAPKFGAHTLNTPLVPTLSVPGQEQFGINLVDNSNPDVGSDPVQSPSDGVEFGKPSVNYQTPDMFMFISGDTVAYSEADSGRTDYTISMIVNISNATPAGHYFGDYAVVVVPAF